MDLREKLIGFLDDVEYETRYVEKEFKTLYKAISLISKGVTVHEWIPVTERLPELSGEYLVYCGEYDGICVLYYEILKTKGKWRTQWKEVTHWMPLPDPPNKN